MTDQKRLTELQGDSPDYVLMPRSLTSENGAKELLTVAVIKDAVAVTCDACGGDGKGLYGGDCSDCNGDGDVWKDVPVPWATCKDIYAMVVKHLGKEKS